MGILASIVVLIVILAVGPVFRTLPNSCLAAIIVTAMKNMLLQTKQLPVLWRINKLEFLAWMITFWGVVLLDVDYGLYIGVVAMIFLLIVRSQRYSSDPYPPSTRTSSFPLQTSCNFPRLSVIC